jgi:hypothetical protein
MKTPKQSITLKRNPDRSGWQLEILRGRKDMLTEVIQDFPTKKRALKALNELKEALVTVDEVYEED